jgi:hypothetical protein
MNPESDRTTADGFQPQSQAWDPFRPDIIELLQGAQPRRLQTIYYGSNHCFLVTLEHPEAGSSLAVYKPARGEYPLYDFPSGTLYRREVGSWLVNDLLGWQLVPPTVVTQGRYGEGSLQLFIESVEQGEIEVDELRRVALLDAVLNNADRKPDHLLLAEDNRIWCIDHGLTFHAQSKLRTILWHFAGCDLSAEEREDLAALKRSLHRDPRAAELRRLISGVEWRALCDRVQRIVDDGRFPNPRYKPIPYRW